MKMTAEEAFNVFNDRLCDLGRTIVKVAQCQKAKAVLERNLTESLHQTQAAAFQFVELAKNES